jgi:hypothetical protein
MDLALQPPPLRSFSAAPEALEVDFAASQAPQLVTALLRTCLRGEPHEEELWALPVGVRLQYLLAILAAEGERALWAQLRCANDRCGEAIEVDLSPEELIALATEHADDLASIVVDGRRVAVRRPTGADQIVWHNQSFADEREARFAVVADLTELESAALDDLIVASVEETLSDADPLVSLRVDVVCPYCDERRTYDVDLVGLVLARFRERQERLLAEVHALASHYHWTETEILAIPAERRATYLALVEFSNG